MTINATQGVSTHEEGGASLSDVGKVFDRDQSEGTDNLTLPGKIPVPAEEVPAVDVPAVPVDPDDNGGTVPVDPDDNGGTSPDAPMPDAATPERYRVGFLWKPAGINNNRLVVLLPSSFSRKTTKRMDLVKDGTVIESTDRDPHDEKIEYPNGNREHYRFDKPGSGYPAGVVARIVTLDGTVWEWTIANPAGRNDGVVTPQAYRGPFPQANMMPEPQESMRPFPLE